MIQIYNSHKIYKYVYLYSLITLLIFLSSCAGTISKHDSKLVEIAAKQIGTPYVYGGISPSQGFDCSGLIYYVYKQLNELVPRNTKSLYQKSNRVFISSQPGDLIFFDINKKWWHIFNKPDHVGLYVGNGFMIHAPRTGKKVELINFANNSFWRSKYLNTRHLSHLKKD